MYQLPLLKPDSKWRAPLELPDLRGRPMIAVDTEELDEGLAAGAGPGWTTGAGYICGVSMAAKGVAVYAPIRHPEGDCIEEDRVRRWYEDHVRSGTPIVYQNAPYDLGWTRYQWNARAPDILHDSMAAAVMLDENRLEYSLDAICEWQGVGGKDQSLLEEAAVAYRGAIGKKAQNKKLTQREIKGMIWRLPARYVGPYAEQDATATLLVLQKIIPQLEEQDVYEAYRLECDLIPLVLEMKIRGIRVNEETLERTKRDFLGRRDQHLRVLSDNLTIGRAVTMKDVRSRTFLEKVFTDLKIPYPRTAATDKYAAGQASFESEWLEKIDHWLPQSVAKATKFHDAADKFIGNYIQKFSHMGRIHADVHQFRDEDGGTRTYRLSYSKPPLQQMPVRDEDIGPAIRRAFEPEEGEFWLAPDISQQEYRLIVHFAYVCRMAGAKAAVQMYRDDPNTDFHNLVVEMTGLARKRAKDCNFAKSYGAGIPKFALMTGMSQEEAAKVMTQYDEKMPFVARMNEFCNSRAQERGYLRTLDGARIRFDRWEPRWISKEDRSRGWRDHLPMEPCSLEKARERVSDKSHPWRDARLRRAFTHKAMNGLVQGSAARQTKLAMRACWREGIVPMIQMHDELGISSNDPKQVSLVAQIMRDAVRLEVPVKVDSEAGLNWGDAVYTKNKLSGIERLDNFLRAS